jgi:putative transposon-encoded protein
VPDSKNQNSKENSGDEKETSGDDLSNKVKFEIYGEEMIEKRVKSSGNSGRVYLPPNWVGHKVKIIRTD